MTKSNDELNFNLAENLEIASRMIENDITEPVELTENEISELFTAGIVVENDEHDLPF